MPANALLYFRVVFFCLAIGVIAADLYLLVVFGPQGTISELLREIGNRWGMFPYLVAFAMGAFFCHIFGVR